MADELSSHYVTCAKRYQPADLGIRLSDVGAGVVGAMEPSPGARGRERVTVSRVQEELERGIAETAARAEPSPCRVRLI